MTARLTTILQYWSAVIRTTVKLWLEAQVFVHVALAFFTVFSVAPVVIIAVSLVELVLGEVRLRPHRRAV